jgi:hypothetical protein
MVLPKAFKTPLEVGHDSWRRSIRDPDFDFGTTVRQGSTFLLESFKLSLKLRNALRRLRALL